MDEATAVKQIPLQIGVLGERNDRLGELVRMAEERLRGGMHPVPERPEPDKAKDEGPAGMAPAAYELEMLNRSFEVHLNELEALLGRVEV